MLANKRPTFQRTVVKDQVVLVARAGPSPLLEPATDASLGRPRDCVSRETPLSKKQTRKTPDVFTHQHLASSAFHVKRFVTRSEQLLLACPLLLPR